MAKEKEKDPAFLFYPKDWIQGTSHMMPEEKGIYIDLLAHQHQNKDLPNNTKRLAKMVGLSLDEFLPIWEHVKVKFVLTDGDRLVNRKLTKLTTKRSTDGVTNRITGTFAYVIRTSKFSTELKEEIKKLFKVNDFFDQNDQNLTESVTEWVTKIAESRSPIGSKSIVNANGNNKEESLNNNTGIDNIEGVKNNFNTMPVCTDFNGLPEKHNSNTIQALKLTKQVTVDSETVIGLWEVFKIQTLTGKKHYHNKEEVYTHFTNWMKKQNFENGNNKQHNGNTSTKLGTSEARVDALKKW